MPLRAVVPSLLTNSLRLLSVYHKHKDFSKRQHDKDSIKETGSQSCWEIKVRLWNAHIPSLLLTSAKFWLWTIFSTMSSASMRVSSTQVGWFSTESFLRLQMKGLFTFELESSHAFQSDLIVHSVTAYRWRLRYWTSLLKMYCISLVCLRLDIV